MRNRFVLPRKNKTSVGVVQQDVQVRANTHHSCFQGLISIPRKHTKNRRAGCSQTTPSGDQQQVATHDAHGGT